MHGYAILSSDFNNTENDMAASTDSVSARIDEWLSMWSNDRILRGLISRSTGCYLTKSTGTREISSKNQSISDKIYRPLYVLTDTKLYYIDDTGCTSELHASDWDKLRSLFPVNIMKYEPATLEKLRLISLLTGHCHSILESRRSRYTKMFAEFNHKTLPNDERHIEVSMSMSRKIFASDFKMDDQQIMEEFEKDFTKFRTLQPSNSQLNHALALQSMFQFATLMAKYLEKPEFIKTIVNLSKKSESCYRVPDGSKLVVKDSTLIQTALLSFPKLAWFRKDLVIKKIKAVFLDSKLFDMGLQEIENALAVHWTLFTSLPPVSEMQQLQSFERKFPDLDTFLWWKNLPEKERKMNGLMSSVLRAIEQTDLLPDSEVDYVPRFWGFVPNETANQMVKIAGRFSESSLCLPGVIHGVHAHRIQWAVIRILIQKKVIDWHETENIKTLLSHIIDNKLWGGFFDSAYAWFGSPSFLMSYLRNAEHFPKLRLYATFSFMNAINKIMQVYQIPDSDYETFIYGQLCHWHFFYHDEPAQAVIEKITGKQDVRELTIGPNYFFYHKNEALLPYEITIPGLS